jgi:ribosomal protein S18 acetylase RimI-like enzyme
VEGLDLRPLSEEDAEPAAALQRALERALGYERETTAAELVDRWRFTDLAGCSWAFEERGGLVAVGWVLAHGEVAVVNGVVAPTWHGRGLGARLCELGEEKARDLGLPRAHQHAYEADAAARTLFASRGYHEVRRFFEMGVELDQAPAVPSWPEGIEPRPFAADDARAYYEAIGESFSEEWGFVQLPFDEWRRLRVELVDTSLYFAAWDGAEIAGVIRCEERPRRTGFVGMIGVRRNWRRRGVGRALLLHALGAFHERGTQLVSLGVDAENPTGATRLYESVGMSVRAAAVIFEKELV